MGHITKLSVGRWVTNYGLTHFVETGVDQGGAITALLSLPFKHLYSIELLPEQIVRASANIERDRPRQSYRWSIVQGDSGEVLPQLAASLPADARVLWWLDAHFPERYTGGADAQPHTAKDASAFELEARLPLVREVLGLVAARDVSRDIIAMDDWRVYEDGPYPAGPLPAFLRPAPGQLPDPDGAARIRDALSPTHTLHLMMADGGYMVAFPK